jgi:glycosyltransferase involved in cell wall biosynthesis
MGCGSLVFAHDNDFNRETLGTAGIYFDSIEDLTSKIEQAEEDEDELAGLKCAAKARARMHYGWDGIIKRYSELLCNSDAGDPRS